ncbi:MAG: alkaline phosphatase family protein [Micropruina sp.]|nr:alkaline phosphatase family protein [Micropruina sp.]
MPWTSNTTIPDQLSRSAPALAAFGEQLHLVHAGDSSNQIWWSHTADGENWTANVPLPDQLSKGPSALAVFGDRLHIVHQGDSSNQLWHSSFDGTRWTTNARIAGESAQSPPALATFGGLLHCLHNGDSSHRLYHLVFDGQRWTKRPDDPGLRGQLSKGAPALAEFGGLLHLVHQGDSSDQLWHSVFDGTGWSVNEPIAGQLSKSPPALAALGNLLHLVHLGDSANTLWHSTFDGSAWADNIAIPYQLSKAAPALAAYRERLHMVHLGDTSNRLWHSSSDGVLVRRPERRVVIIDLDGLRWDTFYAHLKRARDGGGGLDAGYRFTLPSGASDDTVLGDGGQQLNSAFAELCLGEGSGMVDVRLPLTGYPSFTFPMHATMYTGCWPGRHGVAGNSFLVRDASPEWDRHDWESLPRALSLAGFCTDETGSFGAFLDYLWGGFDQVSAGACRNRNRGLNSDLRVPTVFELAEAAGRRTCAIHSFYHGAARPWESEGRDQWWHYDAFELRSVKDICSDADIDQLEPVDHAMFTKASLLTRFRPSTVSVQVPNPQLPPTIGLSAGRRDGVPSSTVSVSGEPHPDGIPDLIALYAASIDEASHTEGVHNQATHLAWFDHRLARFARDLRAADPEVWPRTVFALVADHGHAPLAASRATDGMASSTLQAVREELLRMLVGDAEAKETLRRLKGTGMGAALLAELLKNDGYAINQALNLYVYLRDPNRLEPSEVARRLLRLAAPTEPYGALVLVGDEYRFLARGETDLWALDSAEARAAIVPQLDVPGSASADVLEVSLTTDDEAAERSLRGRLATAEAFDLLRVRERVAGFHPNGNRSMPDVIALAPAGRTFTGGPASHGSFAYTTSRIPMVFFGPGMPAGRRTLETADLVDFAPTVLALLGLPIPADLDGRPLVGLDGSGQVPGRSAPGRTRPRRRLPLRPVGSTEQLREVVREVSLRPVSADRVSRSRSRPVLVSIELKPGGTGAGRVVRGDTLQASLTVDGRSSEHLVVPCTLELPRQPAWLAEVFTAAATAPGRQLAHADLSGVTLTSEQFDRLVGGLEHVLSIRRRHVSDEVPQFDLEQTPPLQPGPRVHAGRGGVIEAEVTARADIDPAGGVRGAVPPAARPAGGVRRRSVDVDVTELEQLEPDRPHSTGEGQTPMQLTESALIRLEKLFTANQVADLSVPGRHC